MRTWPLGEAAVHFLSQASTCASGGPKGPGTPLPSGAGCEPCAPACRPPHVLPGLLRPALLWEVRQGGPWAWVTIKLLGEGHVGLCPGDCGVPGLRLREAVHQADS